MLGFTEFRGCLSSAISLFRFAALRRAPPRISSPHIALLCFASLRLASRLVSLSLTLLRCAYGHVEVQQYKSEYKPSSSQKGSIHCAETIHYSRSSCVLTVHVVKALT
jgi:hypothetical protein